MIERSAALALSGPPRSTRCSAIRSLALRIQGLRPSTLGKKAVPFVIRDRLGSLAETTRLRPPCDSNRASDMPVVLPPMYRHPVGEEDSACFPGASHSGYAGANRL